MVCYGSCYFNLTLNLLFADYAALRPSPHGEGDVGYFYLFVFLGEGINQPHRTSTPLGMTQRAGCRSERSRRARGGLSCWTCFSISLRINSTTSRKHSGQKMRSVDRLSRPPLAPPYLTLI